MRLATVSLNRQIIRLCKGILKAWEQWVDETEDEKSQVAFQPKLQANQEHELYEVQAHNNLKIKK